VPSKFLLDRAAHLVDLDELVDSRKPAFEARYIALLSEPQQRDEMIIEDTVGYLYERMLDETGNEVLSDAYVAEIAEYLDMDWREIHSVPTVERGDVWSTGRQLVSYVCERQAFFELVAIDALDISAQMARANKKAAQRMTTSQKKEMSKSGGIKQTINQLKKEKENA